MKTSWLVLAASAFVVGAMPSVAVSQIVRFATNQGNIDVTLLPDVAPKTVANFLNYVNKGAYSNSIIHRSVSSPAVIQGGGFTVGTSGVTAIAADAAVANEYTGVANVRGTLAMAQLGGDPNSATDQWFFNTSDNLFLDTTANGPFVVFGRVASASLGILDKIRGLPTANLAATVNAALTDTPLVGYGTSSQNYVIVSSIAVLTSPTVSGVISASAFGGFAAAAPGSFIEIYGTNLAGTTRGWDGTDFNYGYAPTQLDLVTVTVGGKPAFVNFVSPAQVNVQVPAGAPVGGSVPVVVTSNGQVAAATMLAINALEPGLLAPSAFAMNGKQYAVALHADFSFVGNGSVGGVKSSAARPGETITFYGVGFGPVAGDTPVAGFTAPASTVLSTPVSLTFGGVPAALTYFGLAPGFVGLYQFNVTVPAEASDGDLPVVVTLGGTVLPQVLFVTIHS